MGFTASRKKCAKLKPGRPSCERTSQENLAAQKSRGLNCFCQIYPGCRHPCDVQSRQDNVRKLVPPKDLEAVAFNILREKSHEGNSATLSTRGSPSTWVPIDKKYKSVIAQSKSCISIKSIQRAKLKTGVSDNALKKIVSEFRSEVRVERGVQ